MSSFSPFSAALQSWRDAYAAAGTLPRTFLLTFLAVFSIHYVDSIIDYPERPGAFVLFALCRILLEIVVVSPLALEVARFCLRRSEPELPLPPQGRRFYLKFFACFALWYLLWGLCALAWLVWFNTGPYNYLALVLLVLFTGFSASLVILLPSSLVNDPTFRVELIAFGSDEAPVRFGDVLLTFLFTGIPIIVIASAYLTMRYDASFTGGLKLWRSAWEATLTIAELAVPLAAAARLYAGRKRPAPAQDPSPSEGA